MNKLHSVTKKIQTLSHKSKSERKKINKHKKSTPSVLLVPWRCPLVDETRVGAGSEPCDVITPASDNDKVLDGLHTCGFCEYNVYIINAEVLVILLYGLLLFSNSIPKEKLGIHKNFGLIGKWHWTLEVILHMFSSAFDLFRLEILVIW